MLDARYVGDITYVATWEGWAYLATVIDLASRRVVGWALADHMRTELVSDALMMAFGARRLSAGATTAEPAQAGPYATLRFDADAGVINDRERGPVQR